MNKNRIDPRNSLGTIKGKRVHEAGTIGTMTGMNFEDGGKAEILFDGGDLSSILDEIKKMEGKKETFDTKLGVSLESLSDRYFESNVVFRFKVQMGAHRIEFKPAPEEK